MPGQILQCFLGQYGVQMASATWELLCVENQLDPDGRRTNSELDVLHTEAIFSRSQPDLYTPRCVMIDTEPSVIDEIRIGCYRSLFKPHQLINGYEDSASNFARGYYRNRHLIMEPSMEAIRRVIEDSDQLEAFTMHHSCSGGTGSGFTAALLQKLHDEYPKRTRLQVSLFSSPSIHNSTVEPYNALLSCHVPIESSDLTMLNDNTSLANTCTHRIRLQKPSVSQMNRLLAQVVSGLFTSMHTSSQLPIDISSLQTNLVPYPIAHFVVGALAPIFGNDDVTQDDMGTPSITKEAFDPGNQFLTCSSMNHPLYLACCLLYRGAAEMARVNGTIRQLKLSGKIPWVDWCPTGFKIAISNLPMTSLRDSHIRPCPVSLLMLHNSTLLAPSLSRVLKQFRWLFSRRAFVHWYTGEGMDEAEFIDTYEKLSDLREEYLQFEKLTSSQDSVPVMTTLDNTEHTKDI